MGTIEDFFYQKNRQGGYAFDPPSWSQKQPEPPVTKQPTSPYTAFTQRPVATQTPQAYGTPGDFSAYKVPGFTQQWGAPDGSTSSTPQFGVRDAFIQNINGAISPFAANPSLAPPQLDLQALYGNAQDMVANGWQNPFTQAFQPSTPQYSGLPTAPSPQSQGIQDLFKQNNIQAPPGFIDQLITLLGGSAPRPALPSPATKYPAIPGPNDDPHLGRVPHDAIPAPTTKYPILLGPNDNPYKPGNARPIQPAPQGTPYGKLVDIDQDGVDDRTQYKTSDEALQAKERQDAKNTALRWLNFQRPEYPGGPSEYKSADDIDPLAALEYRRPGSKSFLDSIGTRLGDESPARILNNLRAVGKQFTPEEEAALANYLSVFDVAEKMPSIGETSDYYNARDRLAQRYNTARNALQAAFNNTKKQKEVDEYRKSWGDTQSPGAATPIQPPSTGTPYSKSPSQPDEFADAYERVKVRETKIGTNETAPWRPQSLKTEAILLKERLDKEKRENDQFEMTLGQYSRGYVDVGDSVSRIAGKSVAELYKDYLREWDASGGSLPQFVYWFREKYAQPPQQAAQLPSKPLTAAPKPAAEASKAFVSEPAKAPQPAPQPGQAQPIQLEHPADPFLQPTRGGLANPIQPPSQGTPYGQTQSDLPWEQPGFWNTRTGSESEIDRKWSQVQRADPTAAMYLDDRAPGSNRTYRSIDDRYDDYLLQRDNVAAIAEKMGQKIPRELTFDEFSRLYSTKQRLNNNVRAAKRAKNPSDPTNWSPDELSEYLTQQNGVAKTNAAIKQYYEGQRKGVNMSAFEARAQAVRVYGEAAVSRALGG
jgi:hypothetical protein